MNANTSQGAAYVLVKPPSGWEGPAQQTAELTATDGAENDRLGRTVAVSGNTVVAGAPSHLGKGAAYVFVRPASGWKGPATQSAELTATDGAAEDRLGSSVAVSGNTVVAGALNHAIGLDANRGAAYVFVMPASGWAGSLTATAELTAGGGAAGDFLGGSVAVSGNTVIVGASGSKVGANIEQGAVYVFVMPASGWAGSLTQTGELTASDGAAEDFFGASVAASGSTVIVGALGRYVGSNAAQGAVYAFVAPPSIVIASPVNGATYNQGQAVGASYSCGAAGDAIVATCAGPVASGATIDTQTLGSHTFTVTARDSYGVTATQTASYMVAAVSTVASAPMSTPIVSGASQTATRWRENGTSHHVSTNRGKKLPVGTTFSFSLNEAAIVVLTFTEPAAGRKVHRKCVAPSAKNRSKPRCTRTIFAGRLTFAGHPGTNRIRFAGRISRTRRLKPGHYTLQIVATNTQGQSSAPRSLTFTIVK